MERHGCDLSAARVCNDPAVTSVHLKNRARDWRFFLTLCYATVIYRDSEHCGTSDSLSCKRRDGHDIKDGNSKRKSHRAPLGSMESVALFVVDRRVVCL